MSIAPGGVRSSISCTTTFAMRTAVGDLTRIILSALEARHLKSAARLADFLLPIRPRQQLAEGLELRHGRVAVSDPDAFLQTPLNLLRLFEEALRTRSLLHPDAMRLVAGNLERVDDSLRRDPAANRIFLDTLLNHGNPERALRRMNEVGLLGAFLPDFGRIVAMMQFNMYHHYTVDEHTIQCIASLAELERRRTCRRSAGGVADHRRRGQPAGPLCGVAVP